jgi:diguanylate cyclase (GGDEF)-like protein/PAS domain S-box-containing protein
MLRGMTDPGAVASRASRDGHGARGVRPTSPWPSPRSTGEATRSRRASFARTLWRHLPKGSTLPDEMWAQRHRWILVLLWLHVPALFAFSLVRHQTVAHSTVEMSVIAIFAFTATTLRPRRRLSTVITSLGLLTCSATLVHLSGGVIEMHFHYFVMVGVITLYQDWWPFLIAIAYVVFQHGAGGVLAPSSVYNHQSAIDHPWQWAAIHGGFILGLSAAGVASWKLNESLLQAASDREEKLAEAQRVARIGSWEWEVGTGRVTWSDELYRLFGVADVDFTPSTRASFPGVHPDDHAAIDDDVRSALEGGPPLARDFRVTLSDGSVRWVHGRGAVTLWMDGRPIAMSGTVQDITDRKRAEAHLGEALSLLGAALDSTADGILVVDGHGRISRFNRQFAEMWRLPDAVLESGDDDQALAWVVEQLSDPEAFLTKVHDLYARPEAESYDVIDFLDGRTFDRHSKPQFVDGEVVGRVWSFRDITEHKRLQNELTHQAFHDALTQLANQALFRDRVEHALVRAGRSDSHLAVLFLDLDNFKTVNDSLGHNAGDELLVAMADRLGSCLRPEDTAARMGGDEFAVLLEDLPDKRDATELAGRVLETLQRPLTIAGREMFIGVSVGIAFGVPGTDSDQLLRNADLAMYTAKSRGKGRYEIFEPEMHAIAVRRLEMEADLRRALDFGELVVHYQPIVALATRRMSGVEALVRWQHPERGLLPPSMFIGLAEETGLIHQLGRQVLEAACMQVRRWQVQHSRHATLSVSVNLSPHQLTSDVVVGEVRNALDVSGLPASSLILEITEGVMMHDTEATIQRLRALKAIGVRLAVDDFGTGYSSLSYLQRFPIDILKIDRSFVAAIDSGEDEHSLARPIVSLARSLHLQTVAEGVETGAQADVLRKMRCDLAQGFYMAAPQGAEAIGALLRDEGILPAVVPEVAVAEPLTSPIG